MNAIIKKIFILLVLLVINTAAYSQIIYKGNILDRQQKPVEFANVVVYNTEDSTLLNGSISNRDGSFSFELTNANDYYLEVSFLGYETKSLQLDSSKNIGIIILQESKNTLDEIVVKAKKQHLIRKNDRLIFNIDNTPVQDMGSAIDVLKVTPNVIMRDNELKMLGKNNITVMINGKMMPLQGDDLTNYLSSINSSNIKAIEIITTPPSEFESAGNGGIVNILLKKPRNDFWSVVTRLSGTKRTKSSYSDNVALNFKKKNTYFTFSVAQGKYVKNNTFKNNFYYKDEIWEGKSPNMYQDDYLNYRLSITQNITDKWEIGANYSGTNSNTVDQTNNADAIFDLSKSLKTTFLSKGLSKQNAQSNAFNIYNVFTLDSLGRSIALDFDYYNSASLKDGANSGDNVKSDITHPVFSNDTQIKYGFSNYSSKIDASLPFNGIKVKLGAKISISKTNNDFKFYDTFKGSPIFDRKQSNVFNYKENIFAGFISVSKQLSNKTSAKAGLRAERTVTNAYSKADDKFSGNDYLEFFPTLFLTYNMKDQKSLSFNINKRLNRPNFESLDPFKMILNPFKTVQGNPFLKPSYMTNMELIFNTSKNELKVYAQKLDDSFGQLSEINPSSKIVNYTYLNYINSINFGITNTYIFDKLNWLTSYNTADIGYSKVSSPLAETIGQQKGFNAFFQTQNYIHLNPKKTFSFGANYYYVLPSKVQLYHSTGFGSLDLSLTLKLLDGNLSISMYANDILDSSRALVALSHNGVKATFNNYYDSKSLKINVRYTFGNHKISTKSRHYGNDDIQNRAQ